MEVSDLFGGNAELPERYWASEPRSRHCRKETMDQHLQDEPVV
jgi:hypothetical protein